MGAVTCITGWIDQQELSRKSLRCVNLFVHLGRMPSRFLSSLQQLPALITKKSPFVFEENGFLPPVAGLVAGFSGKSVGVG